MDTFHAVHKLHSDYKRVELPAKPVELALLETEAFAPSVPHQDVVDSLLEIAKAIHLMLALYKITHFVYQILKLGSAKNTVSYSSLKNKTSVLV